MRAGLATRRWVTVVKCPAAGVATNRKEAMRTKTYDAIVVRLSDGKWHPIDELWDVTSDPAAWLKILSREPDFEFDPDNGRMRMLSSPRVGAKPPTRGAKNGGM
jgi:hypothetical protein